MALYGAMRVSVASVTASASAITSAALAKSPRHVTRMANAVRSIGSRASAPASRASWSWRVLIACHVSSSQSTLHGTVVNQPQRKFSSVETPSAAKAAAARLSIGAALARPSVISSANPSSSKLATTCRGR